MEMSFDGKEVVEITSADIENTLGQISDYGVSFRHVMYVDSLSVKVEINKSDMKLVEAYIAKHGGSIKILRKRGLYWKMKGMLQRPLLLIGMCIIVFLVSWIPTRVFFITVEGNERITTRHIIEQANLCGIRFGASRREVRSEKMKNSLLSAIPSLQWAGINTSGCTAIISIKERTDSVVERKQPQVSSIIAVRDGVIESCTTQKGDQLCETGSVVKRGDVLISGYTDCGIKIVATRAEGEVFAQTRHELTVLTPTDYKQKGEITKVEKKYGLLIGKKRINFYKGSGISGGSCDKIYEEFSLTLPGGFQLPIAVVVCTIRTYDQSLVSAVADTAEQTAREGSYEYLISQMISGRILRDNVTTQQRAGACVLTGEYVCSEMIGRVQNEEIINKYGEDHRENR